MKTLEENSPAENIEGILTKDKVKQNASSHNFLGRLGSNGFQLI